MFDANARATLGLQALAELKFIFHHLLTDMASVSYRFAYDFRNFNAQHSQRDLRRYYALLRASGISFNPRTGLAGWYGLATPGSG